MMNKDKIVTYLQELYPDNWENVACDIQKLVKKWQAKDFPSYGKVTNEDVVLITYGDAIQNKGQSHLSALNDFMHSEFSGSINSIHLLPMFPYSSDDGFSVIDFYEIDPELGTWDDIEKMQKNFGLMFDAVLNHASAKGNWFKKFLQCRLPEKEYFIVANPAKDYSLVTRPRTSPLLTPFKTTDGEKYVWTTFSDDQIDLNYKSSSLLITMLDILLLYAHRGSRFIRFDAIGFAWKEENTSCIHLPEAHTLVKLMRAVIQSCAPNCSIITETNVPHAENISYFGNGHDEAAMVYQFPLPPLVFNSFLNGNATHLSNWAASLEPPSKDTTYFNFLASHDGIGMRPIEDILNVEERQMMADATLARGGEIGYRTLPNKTEVPYELNINYMDAIAGDVEDDTQRANKFLASQCILLSMAGMPGIYYHSLLGSRGWREGFEKSGIKRRINREKLDMSTVSNAIYEKDNLRNLVVDGYKKMLSLRKIHTAFSPERPQEIVTLAPQVFALFRGEEDNRILVLINVSGKEVLINPKIKGTDIISGKAINKSMVLQPWQYCWISAKRS